MARTGRPRAELTTYAAAHNRLRTDRGRASTHPCIACGRPARDWAWQLGGEVLTDEKTGRIWSRDLDDYAPMCRSCHFKRDVQLDPNWLEVLRSNGWRQAVPA